ncbi:hypothetical protein [Marinilactibacillus piezotolerans]|uniref:hypothetical protein n=1 Tax=Marinilactibacillus piezotolerans TaxID=258723 RepID=UPI0009B0B617|nr:hypothetical protein [Marinilactibacillus piezotolerans]
MIGLLYSILFGYNTPLLTLVRGNGIPQVVLTIQFAYITYNGLQSYLSIRKLRNNMKEGKKIDHQAPWRKLYRRTLLLKAVISLFMGVVFFILIMQLIQLNSTTFSESSEDLPIVRLSAIEESLLVQEGEEDSNVYAYSNWSPLAPEQLDVHEDGAVLRDAEGYASGGYTPYLNNEVYDLTLASLSNQLINDLIKAHRYEKEDELYIEKEHPVLDRLVVYDEYDQKEVYASKNGVVMYVDYKGKQPVEKVVQATVEELNSSIR